ncbi:hypothetical protein HRF87_21655 [Bacillus sp. CRN 9]|nr:hypothetical protein [Bacillus sp. CRN 9]
MSNKFNFGDIPDLSNIEIKPFVPPIQNMSNNFGKLSEEMGRIAEEKERKESEYKLDVLNTLKGIEKNTAILSEMIVLLQKDNENQEEIFKVLVEILEIMKSSNEEEAASAYKKVMKKITTITEDASTIQTLIGIGQTVYTTYQSLPLTLHPFEGAFFCRKK